MRLLIFLFLSAMLFSAIMAVNLRAKYKKSPVLHRKPKLDPEFVRRYDRLKSTLKNRPLERAYLKHFLRNDAQRRDKRQVRPQTYYYSTIRRGYPYDRQIYSALNFARPQQGQRVRGRPVLRQTTTTRRPTTKKPFRPPMPFFK